MAHNRTLLDQLCEEMDKLCTSTGNQVQPFERRGNDLDGHKNFYLKAKARFWP